MASKIPPKSFQFLLFFLLWSSFSNFASAKAINQNLQKSQLGNFVHFNSINPNSNSNPNSESVPFDSSRSRKKDMSKTPYEKKAPLSQEKIPYDKKEDSFSSLISAKYESFWGKKSYFRVLEGTNNVTKSTGGESAERLSRKWPKFKMDGKNAAAMAISVVAASLANAAGVGGGGMFVPMFSMLGFDTKTATALSQAMITGGSLTAFLYNLRLQHPSLPRPLIDYSACLLLEPTLLLGVSMGVVANVVLPAWLIVTLLGVLLTYMTQRTLSKGISTWKLETQQAKERRLSQMVDMTDSESGPENRTEGSRTPSREQQSEEENRIEPASGDVTLDEISRPTPESPPSEAPFLEKTTMAQLRRLKVLIMSESSIIPKWRLLEVLVIWILFLWLQIFKGGRSSPSIVGVKSCHHWFWVLLALQVAAATGSLMVLFSSSMAVAQFWILHLVPLEYALIYGGICAVAGFVGLVLVRVAIRKYGRNSIIIFSLAIVIGASAVVIIVTGSISIKDQITKHDYMGFQELCSLQ